MTDTSKRNFIIARLCDNDFGHHLHEACEYVFNNWGNELEQPELQRRILVLTAAFSNTCRHHTPEEEKSTVDYLTKTLQVTYSEYFEYDDNGGGSVAVDCNTNHIWRF